jgi:purine-binding chemotaxis protein CheW
VSVLVFLCDRERTSGKALKTVVILRCGAVIGALDRSAVREIAPLPNLAHPPSLPANVEGVVDVGGEAVIVVSLAAILGLPEETAGEEGGIYQHLVLLAGDMRGVALRVERVADVRVINEAEVTPAAGVSLNGCVTGQIELDGERVHLLDANRIFLSAERDWLADLQRKEQARLDALVAT